MTQGFFQFNNSIINQIINFATSSFDLLFMAGPKGSSKSETLNKAIEEFSDDFLVFQHFCFSNTVIDDFLLNFYDELRNFSLDRKISLKKFASDNFKEKVSHYFKTIGANCIIAVENFENVENNLEIINFLCVLANFENVKVIVVSRNPEKNLFRFQKVKMKTINFLPLTKEEFDSKLTVLAEPFSNEFKQKFYEISQGFELYLKMALKYCSVTNVSPVDLTDEFERKNNSLKIDFEEFLVSKFVSITPSAYKELFRILCILQHPVSSDFLKEYNLADPDYASYLAQNFLLGKFKNEYYVKDYFKQYIIKNFSIKEKMTYYKKMVQAYENELTKSPKDRLIRLSRESIRKEISSFKDLIPQINPKNKDSKAFSYIGMTSVAADNEKLKQKEKLSEKLNKIKERKNILLNSDNLSQKNNNPDTKSAVDKNDDKRIFVVRLINSARDYAKAYKYKEAIDELYRAYEFNCRDFEIEILLNIAKNYEHLNEYENAQKFYQSAHASAMELNDPRKSEIEFLIAVTNKNLYKIDLTKEQFLNIVQNQEYPNTLKAKAYMELGEIDEVNSQFALAIEDYKNSLALLSDDEIELICKNYYKLAVLYDENQDSENAIKYYQKNYTTSTDRKENKYYSASLTNLALIYMEKSDYRGAIEYFKLALFYDSEINDLENMYFSQKELAKLNARLGRESALEYFKMAMDSAKKLKDSFKEALIYFEAGDFYYDRQEDKLALSNFLNAKKVLKNTSDNENLARINSRINDIKVRLDSDVFNSIMEKYDN